MERNTGAALEVLINRPGVLRLLAGMLLLMILRVVATVLSVAWRGIGALFMIGFVVHALTS